MRVCKSYQTELSGSDRYSRCSEEAAAMRIDFSRHRFSNSIRRARVIKCCGNVIHQWAAQQCLIRMVRLQWIALPETSRQAWGKALLLHLVKRRSTCGSESSNDSSTRDVRLPG